jgi:hypothetical protein
MGINSQAGFRYALQHLKILVPGELYFEPVITFQVVHMGCHVMEELCSMCDGGDCWISPTSEIDSERAQHKGEGSPHPSGWSFGLS